MNKSDIIKLCKDLGCCDACCLRYIGSKAPSTYEKPLEYILTFKCSKSMITSSESTQSENIIQSTPNNETLDTTTENTERITRKTCSTDETTSVNTDDSDVNEKEKKVKSEADLKDKSSENGESQSSLSVNQDEPQAKRCKTDGVCVSCLGLLQEETWPECYSMVKEMLGKKCYESDTFACALSAPIATILRERAVTLRINHKFPDYDAKSLTPLKEAWKWCFATRLASHIGKALDSGAISRLLVTLNMEYPDDLQELEILKTLSPALFQSRSQQRRRFAVEFTRRSVEQALDGATLPAMEALGVEWSKGIPSVGARIKCVSVVSSHAPVYLGGRYIKLSRELPQTPWLVNGVRMMESSVQEIIFQPIADLYKMTPEETEHRLKFMSAGREDVDVRCLGDGRPFAIEISDPHRELTAEELNKVCEEISRDGKVVVKSLIHVSKEDLSQLKKGEETKCKTYNALCIKLSHSQDEELTANGDKPIQVTDRDIDKINKYSNTDESDASRIVLSQKTPIRVLHRRPLLTRTRRVLELSAERVPDHPQLLTVKVVTEAGTYVKEWAHGEARRTRPSLGDAIGAKVDILALDVASIHLGWPPVLRTL